MKRPLSKNCLLCTGYRLSNTDLKSSGQVNNRQLTHSLGNTLNLRLLTIANGEGREGGVIPTRGLFPLRPPTGHRLHDILLRTPRIRMLDEAHLFLHELLVFTLLALIGSWNRLGLLEFALASPAAVPFRVDALGVALELGQAHRALPYVFEVDIVAMLGRHIDVAVAKGGCDLDSPGLELLSVRVGGDARNHEVGQVAELVGDDVEETMFVVDDFGRKLDRGVVSVSRCDCFSLPILRLDRLALPISTASRGVQLVGPFDADAACCSRELGELVLGDASVQLEEKLVRKIVL